MMNKIFKSLLIISGITLLIVGVSVAFFSDEETSVGNMFQAGAIDLSIDNECHYNEMVCRDGVWVGEEGGYPVSGEPCTCTWSADEWQEGTALFNFSDLKPGDNGEDTISIHIDSNPAWVCAEVINVTQYENGCNEPEGLVDATCGEPGEGEGELKDNLFFSAWMDEDCDNIFDIGEEEYILENANLSEVEYAVADSQTGGDPITDACVGVSWYLPESVGNAVQTDSVKGDIKFYAVQARHNSDFVCGSDGLPATSTPTPIPQPTEEPEPLVVRFSSLGAEEQFGDYLDYSQSIVTFTYQSPANPTLSGVIEGSGLKPYATYQVKFEGIPTCIDPVNGNDDANEYIGYAGRWTCPACSGTSDQKNRSDAQYEANELLDDSNPDKECIVGYLVWDYFTADHSGNVNKSISTENSYHVLWCGGGTCNTNNNTYLQNLSGSEVPPGFPYCDPEDVNGQTEPGRAACGALDLDPGMYDLIMALTEESFHQNSFGYWTGVMQTPISFELE